MLPPPGGIASVVDGRVVNKPSQSFHITINPFQMHSHIYAKRALTNFGTQFLFLLTVSNTILA